MTDRAHRLDTVTPADDDTVVDGPIGEPEKGDERDMTMKTLEGGPIASQAATDLPDAGEETVDPGLAGWLDLAGVSGSSASLGVG